MRPPDVKPAIRLKAPREGSTVIDDVVQGEVVFANKDLDDLIILRSDGNPTYNLSVVVDDHDMGITHVIRGDDHLTNAARQTQIYNAMGWSTPSFSHVPLIHGPDGAKLSKRHGALGVDAYRAMGYLPPALRNYLVRLGWSHGDQEIFSTEQLIAAFDLPQIGRSPARFDFAKLENLNGHYIRETADGDLVMAMRRSVAENDETRATAAPLDDAQLAADRAGDAGPQGAGKDALELFTSAAYLYRQAAAGDRRRRGEVACRRWQGSTGGRSRRAGRRCRLAGAGARGGNQVACGSKRPEAWQDRPAVARGTHRKVDLARHIRCACRTRPRRIPRPYRRPDGIAGRNSSRRQKKVFLLPLSHW